MQHYRGIRTPPDVEPQLAKKYKNILTAQVGERPLEPIPREAKHAEAALTRPELREALWDLASEKV